MYVSLHRLRTRYNQIVLTPLHLSPPLHNRDNQGDQDDQDYQEYKSERVQEYKSTRVQEYTCKRVHEYKSTRVKLFIYSICGLSPRRALQTGRSRKSDPYIWLRYFRHCYYPHMSKESVSPECGIFKIMNLYTSVLLCDWHFVLCILFQYCQKHGTDRETHENRDLGTGSVKLESCQDEKKAK